YTGSPLSTSEQMKNYKDQISITPSTNKKSEDEHPQPIPQLTEKSLPLTTKIPFEETPDITVDDFYNFKGARVLVVEDNKINQKILQSVLQKSGVLITIANNGQEALEHLYTPDREFDLVLMDISMPVMDGYTCTEKIRSDHRFDMLPIITFTAFAMGKEIERMYAAGANGHMTKPLNSGQLYTVFQTYLGHILRPVSTLSALKMKGLDVEIGLATYEGDEQVYKQMLREFIAIYGRLVKQMPQWIEEKEYEKVKLTFVKIGPKLHSLGAYELEEAVIRMKKFFIYGTEHRIEEFKEAFPEKLNRLIIAMRLYLQDEIL
ncbi:MAG: response regulator, partial [Sulfurovum sp.]